MDGLKPNKYRVFISLGLYSFLSVNVYAESDAFLAEQRVESPKVTQALISEVKVDAQRPIPDQLNKHDQKAKQQADEIKKGNLEEHAASDYELKRKTDTNKLLNTARHEYVPQKTANTVYSVEFENKNVQIGRHIK